MTVGNFIPQVWAAAILENLSPAHVYANCVNTDYDGEIKNFGDTVRINNIGRVTISNYTKQTTTLTPEFLDGAGQTLTIDQAKYFYFAVDDVDRAQAKPKVMSAAMREAAWGLADATDNFLATLLSGAVDTANQLDNNGTRVIGTGGTDSDAYETLVDLKVALDKGKVPSRDRWVVFDPNFLGALLKDPRFTSFGQSANLMLARNGPGTNMTADETPQVTGKVDLGGGALSKMVGMDCYVSLNVPTTGSGSTTTYTIIAGYKGAASYAESIPEGQPEAYRLQTGFSDAVRGLHVYGGKVVRSNAIATVLTQYS